jgi:low affinity Fe/Cu permease
MLPPWQASCICEGMLLLVVVLIVLWALGLMTSYTLGGLLHILLVVAIILFLVHIIQGRSIAD